MTTSWLSVVTDQGYGEKMIHLNSFTCYASPELGDLVNSKRSLIKVKTGNNDLQTLVMRPDPRVRKGCVHLPFSENANVVYMRDAGDMPDLLEVRLVCSVDNSSHEDQAKRLIECLLRENAAVPVSEGGILHLSRQFSLHVANCEPFREGLWSEATKTVTQFDRRTLLPSPYLQSIFHYSLRLIPKGRAEAMLREIQFPYDLREIPSALARRLMRGLEHLSLSSTLFVNGGGCADGGFCVLTSSNGKAVVLQCVSTPKVGRRSVFATPALLQHLRARFEDDHDCVQLSPFASPPKVDFAAKAQISFVFSPAFHSLSTREVDHLVACHFSRPRYVLPDSVGEIVISEDETVHWQPPHEAAGGQNLFYKVVDVDDGSRRADNSVGVLVSASETTLFQKRTLRVPLPPRTVRTTRAQTGSVANLPPFMKTLLEQLAKIALDCTLLVSGPQGSGKEALYGSLSDLLGYSLVEAECCLVVGDSSGATEVKLRQTFSRAAESEPCLLVLKNVEKLSRTREGKVDYRALDRLRLEMEEVASKKVVVLGDSFDIRGADKGLVGLFDHHARVDDLSDIERLATLPWAMEDVGVTVADGVDLREVSRKTAGFLLEDLTHLLKRALFFTRQRLEAEIGDTADQFFRYGPKTDWRDLDKALDEIHRSMADAVGAPKIPSVKWDDVGGLEDAKREILDAIQMPLLHPKLSAAGLRRSGILMFGPPGVGKTLLAKAVATECALNFLSVKGPELLNMYVGQSEQNVRDVFQRARAASPCVIFFDELDSLAPNRGKSGDSGGVMDRVVSQLLAELDGVGDAGMIFVIGATNRPDLIDQALLRPGRFDRLVYLGVAADASEQERILGALVRNFKLNPDFSLEKVLQMIPAGLTGADLYAIASDASLNAISRMIRSAEEMDGLCDGVEVLVSLEDFRAVLDEFSPSVTAEDMAYYDHVKEALN